MFAPRWDSPSSDATNRALASITLAVDSDDADRRAIDRVRAGDKEAFRTLVERYERPVWTLVANLLGRDHARCEDVAQDAFVAAYRALDRYDAGRARFSTWLFAIVRNRCRTERARRREAPLADATEPRDSTTPPQLAARAEARAALDRALDDLPLEQRAAFVLAEVCGLSGAEVATIENAPEGTIRARLSRARAALRAALGGRGGGMDAEDRA